MKTFTIISIGVSIVPLYFLGRYVVEANLASTIQATMRHDLAAAKQRELNEKQVESLIFKSWPRARRYDESYEPKTGYKRVLTYDYQIPQDEPSPRFVVTARVEFNKNRVLEHFRVFTKSRTVVLP